MTKADLVEQVAEAIGPGVTKKDCALVVDGFLNAVKLAMTKGENIEIRGFGTFKVRKRKTRVARNPRTGDPVESVADGLASTARVITAAAAIMAVVFGSFLLEDDRVIQLFGTGLASAIVLDATLVRMLLVPATMELLGSRNWWIPDWLDRLLPRIELEGPAARN